MDVVLRVEPLISELRKLSSLLTLSNAQYKLGAEDHGRMGARDALIAVINFVSQAIPDGAELALPLNQLLYGLRDLDAGQVVPLLQPKKVTKRPPAPFATGLFRAMAAVLMELYQRAGMAREVAAAKAARDLTNLGYLDHKQKAISAAQVEDWRDKMRVEQRTKNPAGQRYSRTLAELEKRFPAKPLAAAQYLLDALPAIEPPAVPRIPPIPPHI